MSDPPVWVLPGGARLVVRDERRVACRSGAAVVQRTWQPGRWRLRNWLRRRAAAWSLGTAKQVLEVLALIVGLIASVLALFGVSRK